jgi:hypothetical protein
MKAKFESSFSYNYIKLSNQENSTRASTVFNSSSKWVQHELRLDSTQASTYYHTGFNWFSVHSPTVSTPVSSKMRRTSSADAPATIASSILNFRNGMTILSTFL